MLNAEICKRCMYEYLKEVFLQGYVTGSNYRQQMGIKESILTKESIARDKETRLKAHEMKFEDWYREFTLNIMAGEMPCPYIQRLPHLTHNEEYLPFEFEVKFAFTSNPPVKCPYILEQVVCRRAR
jgi:hypothetical protein